MGTRIKYPSSGIVRLHTKRPDVLDAVAVRKQEYERIVDEIRKLPNFVAINTVLATIAPKKGGA